MSKTEPFWFLHPSSPIHGSSTTPLAWPTSPSSPIAAPPPPSRRIPSPPHLPPWLLHCPCLRHRCLPVQATLHPSSDPAATNSMAPNPASLVGGRVVRAGRKSAAVAGDRVTVNGASAATDPSTPVVDLALRGADLAGDCPLRRQLVEAGDATAVAGRRRWPTPEERGGSPRPQRMTEACLELVRRRRHGLAWLRLGGAASNDGARCVTSKEVRPTAVEAATVAALRYCARGRRRRRSRERGVGSARTKVIVALAPAGARHDRWWLTNSSAAVAPILPSCIIDARPPDGGGARDATGGMRPEGGDRRRQIWLPTARARCGEFGGCTASLGGLRWGCTLAASPLLDRGRWRISWFVGGDVRMWSWQDDGLCWREARMGLVLMALRGWP